MELRYGDKDIETANACGNSEAERDVNRRGEGNCCQRRCMEADVWKEKVGIIKIEAKGKRPQGKSATLYGEEKGATSETRRVKRRDNNGGRSKDEIQMATTIRYR